MERRAGIVGFLAVTVLLALIAALFICGTVMSRTDVDAKELEEYYLTKEKELTDQVRALLSLEGFENSGVMVTRIVETDGSRHYTVSVHHGEIDSLSDAEKEKLLARISRLSFEDEICSFSQQFH